MPGHWKGKGKTLPSLVLYEGPCLFWYCMKGLMRVPSKDGSLNFWGGFYSGLYDCLAPEESRP